MGARLVSLALVRWTHVSDRAFRVLIRMALTALDDPTPGSPAGLYFGGQDLLALTLRNERGGKRESVLRNVRFAVDELIGEGAIERTKQGRSGQNAVFRLTLDGTRRIDSDDSPAKSQAESSVPPQAESHVPPEAESHVPDRRNPAFPPRNQEEPVEELGEERTTDLRTAVTGSRAREADANPDFIEDETPRLRLVHPAPTRTGFGFCLPCHAAGKVTLAADPISGAACAHHLRQESA